jgi:hypothetical protein
MSRPQPLIRPSWRGTKLAAALAVVGVLVLVPAAAAANIAPNPGFETDCSGLPCGWAPASDAGLTVGVTRSTANPHFGSASLAVTATGTGNGGAFSTCLAISPGNLPVSFWYRTATASILGVAGAFYTTIDCTGPNTSAFVATASALTDNVWHQVSGTLVVPAGTASMRALAGVNCAVVCFNVSANFDDVVVDSTILAVAVTQFEARATRAGVVLRWRTATEAGTLGFHLYRERGTKRVRVDRRLIPAQGGLGGARYSILDRRAPGGALRYRLQAVGTDRSRTWMRTIRVTGRP